MSGLLASHYFRHMEPLVVESQPSLPNNHKALLRFRSSAVSELTGIPFSKVKVQKLISYKGFKISQPDMYLNNMYSQKVTGSVRARSLTNLSDCERFIAPEDFIKKLSNGIDVSYGEKVVSFEDYDEPIISTMPVYKLAELLDYELPDLKYRSIQAISFDLDMDIDVYQTIYYPGIESQYRVSITGNKVIAEFAKDMNGSHADDEIRDILRKLEDDFGIVYTGEFPEATFSNQKYGKLIECEDNSVKKFIGWATREHNVYSLGRWGTHRQILMDDVVKDIRQIDKLISNKGYHV